MERPIPPIAIIGIGNPLLGDDGVGVEVIKEMERLTLPSHVRLYDGGVGGLSLVGLIDGHREAIFVDALEMGLEPGSIRQLDVEWRRDRPSGLSFSFRTGLKPCPYKMVEPRLRYSLHEVSLRECLPFLQLADNPPKITIIGIQPRRVGPEMGLSPEVRGAVPEVIRIIRKGLGVRDG
ncbi:MAG: hydrogenase maturation protease [Planctomycetes bacterium]|nr:hydrogenase maturation protease [Planctomycetota bacterium]